MKTFLKIWLGMCLGMMLGIAIGCATPSSTTNPATLTPALKTAAAIDQVASSIATAQQVEISLHEQGIIDSPTHVAIQKGFLKVGLDGAAITKGINDGISAPSMQALVGVLTTDLEADVSNGALGIKNPTSQATFKASIAAVSVAVELVLQSYVPPAAPVALTVGKP